VWQVVFYEEKGVEPVKDFILMQPDKAIAEILHVFKLLREFGIKLTRPYVDKVGKSVIRELRIKHSSDLYRIFFFLYTDSRFVLLHAIKKKTDKTPVNDIILAKKRMNTYIAIRKKLGN
jgi:phage-related protein